MKNRKIIDYGINLLFFLGAVYFIIRLNNNIDFNFSVYQIIIFMALFGTAIMSSLNALGTTGYFIF